MFKRVITLVLVLALAGSASAAMLGEWLFDNDSMANTGTVGAAADGVANGTGISATGGQLVNDGTGAVSSFMDVGNTGGWADLATYSITFDIDIPDNSDGAWWNPTEKWDAATGGNGDFVMEMTGYNAKGTSVYWRSFYPHDVSYNIVQTCDLSGGMHKVEVGQETRVNGDIVSWLYVDGNEIETHIVTGNPIPVIAGADVHFGGGEKYPSQVNAFVMDNIRFYDTVVPEPVTLALLGLGGLAALLKRRR